MRYNIKLHETIITEHSSIVDADSFEEAKNKAYDLTAFTDSKIIKQSKLAYEINPIEDDG